MATAGRNCSVPDIGWWPYVAAYIGLYTIGIFIILCLTFAHYICERSPISLIDKMAQFIPSDTSTLSGKVLHVMTLMASVIYYVLALYRASINTIYVCTTVTSVILIILVELTLSCFYWVNFIIQLIGARSLLLHWLSPFTVIDVLTLPHSLVSLINGYDWLGFRSLRFLCLIKFDKLIEFLPCVNSSDVAKLVRIMLYFTGLWLAVSGLVQLLESSGDPWDSSVPPRQLTYWSSAYFVIVTLSTVGYGDITMTTVSGKILVTLFIVVNLVMCALVLPSLLNIIICYYQALQYKQIYKIHQSKRYLIVCGHITAQTTDSFLKELFHPDKQDNATYVTFLDPSAPTNELQQTLKRYFTRVQYYIGTPLSTIDLNKCGIHEASSVIVLADRHCLDPFEEDCTNLMRVVSVKTTCNAIPVILQLLSHQSKHMIGSIPKWNPATDRVICLNELKMKILAQSCLIPGFCTLISNLFFTTNLKQIKSNVLARSSWRRLYSLGACKEIYSVKFSAFFHGLTIFETAVVCYEELQLTLLSVVGLSCDNNYIITSGSVGYFMADRIQDVLKAQRYCRACHKTNKSLQQCSCVSEREEPDALSSVVPQHRLHSTPLGAVTISLTCSMTPESLHLTLDTDPPPHPPSSLSNHIVLCVFATTNSITIGLSSFLTSLRSSSDIPVAVVTNVDFFKKEWSTILNRTNIYCIYGNPLDWNCLKEAEITACQTCIVLSASSMSKEDCEYGIRDKQAVMCTLMLRQQLGDTVNIITDLAVDNHIHLLDSHPYTVQPSYLAEPFACGQALISSVFDSLTTIVVHNPGIIDLLDCFLGSCISKSTCGVMVKLPMLLTPYSSFVGNFYKKFYHYMAQKGTLCIGVHRKLCPDSSYRYLITAPSYDVILLTSDVVLALEIVKFQQAS